MTETERSDPSDKSLAWSDPKLVLDQWHKYEAIAMHFNDLLMRFRTQALGGLATVAALAGLVVKDATAFELPVFFLVLLLFWFAAWYLDQGYYSKLLAGAIVELLNFEKHAGVVGSTHRIQLSTTIESVVGGRANATRVVRWFYSLIACGLVILIAATFGRALSEGRASGTAAVALPVTFTVDAFPTSPEGGARSTVESGTQ